jgi:hypothetical protein
MSKWDLSTLMFHNLLIKQTRLTSLLKNLFNQQLITTSNLIRCIRRQSNVYVKRSNMIFLTNRKAKGFHFNFSFAVLYKKDSQLFPVKK